MAAINLVQLYINVLTKALVSVNGSPTQIPPLFYGDSPVFAIYPVMPAGSGNPLGTGGQQFVAVDLSASTCHLTMADAPNAQTPPTPFASTALMTWNVASSAFVGSLDMTQAAVGAFIGSASGKQAYFNFDVFDAALLRTTLLQTTFQLNASIDAVAAGPGGGSVQYLTLAQAYGLFLQIGAVKGKFCVFESLDGSHQKLLTLNNDGTWS